MCGVRVFSCLIAFMLIDDLGSFRKQSRHDFRMEVMT